MWVACASSAALFATITTSCGSKVQDKIFYVTVTPTAAGTTEPTATPTATPTEARASVWMASATTRFLVGYDDSGNLKKVIDLSLAASTGGITAIQFVDSNNLIGFVDPGASGERFVSVNVETGAMNLSWFSDATNFNNVAVNNIIKDTSSILYVNKATGTENLLFDFSKNVVSRVAVLTWPIVNTAACPITTAQYVTKLSHNNADSLLVLSSGANTRLNVWTSISSTPACVAGNSYNYTTSAPTNAAYVPVAAFQAISGKVFVRFQHATTPRIMNFDFDGTTLSNGTDVFTNIAALSANTSSREMRAFGTSMLISDWTNNAVHKISQTGTYEGVFAKDGYTTSVNSIAIRPAAE